MSNPRYRRRSSGGGSSSSSGGITLGPSDSRRSPNGNAVAKTDDSLDYSMPLAGNDVEMDDMGSDDDIVVYDKHTNDNDEEHRKDDWHGRQRRRSSALLNASLGGPGARAGAGAALIPNTGRHDERGPHNMIAVETGQPAASTLFKNIMINGLLISLWYSFSISISVYNKWMFSKENLNFPYPLFTTSLHMVVQFSLSCAVLFFIPRFRPSAAPDVDSAEARYTQLNDDGDGDGDGEGEGETARSGQPTQKLAPPGKQPLMTKLFYFTRIAPCGTATALDIGLGNFSLRFISLTFFTMCKSSVLAFVLLFAFIFGLERPTWRLCAIILLMTVGVIMMVAGEAAFNAAGFILVMTASLCSGFRWSVTQILLLRNRATSNPFSATFFLTPVMFLALILLALPVEGPRNIVHAIDDLARSEGGFLSLGILLFPGFLAFLMVSAEFALLKRTSVVTLSVCGIFKEVLTISAASLVFGDELTPINVSGLFVTIASIAAYNWFKYAKLRQDEAEEAAQEILDAQAAVQRKSLERIHTGASTTGRGSTDALMRDDLAIRTNLDIPQHERKLRETSTSPTKRPEDLE